MKKIQKFLVLIIVVLISTNLAGQDGMVFLSSSDNLKGWNWDGHTASYIALVSGKAELFIRPFDGEKFGPVTRQINMSGADRIRGWNWDGQKTASYIALLSGKAELIIRPFDGEKFGPVTRQINMSGADRIRGWSWDGQTANYVGLVSGKTDLITRPFDGDNFGPVEEQIRTAPENRALDIAHGHLSALGYINGKTYFFSVDRRLEKVDRPIPDPTPPSNTCDIMEDPALNLTLTEQLKKMDGKIIVLKSLRWDTAYIDASNNGVMTNLINALTVKGDGAYIDASNNGGARVSEVPRSKLINATWAKLIVHHIEANIICLESVRYPDAYLDLGRDKICRFTRYNDIPKNEDWARFSIFGDFSPNGGGLSNIGIRSERWDKNRWLDAHHSGDLVGTYFDGVRPVGKWAAFEIMFPGSITSEYVDAFRGNNSTADPIPAEFQYEYGMDYKESESKENKVELSVEMQKNFGTPLFSSGSVKMGAKFSTAWSSASETTWKEKTTIKVPLTIPPFSTLVIKQLQGTYGDGRQVAVKINDYKICIE